MLVPPTILFIHGIRNDDPDGRWHDTLETAMARVGRGTLQQAGFASLSPSWLAVLEGDEPEDDPGPPRLTHVQADDAARRRAEASYYLCQSRLEAALADADSASPGLLASLPSGPVAEVVQPRWLKDVEAYRTSAARRNACLHELVASVPYQGELIVIAHSLGSVLAADLLYVLPPEVTVRLLITIGSPLAYGHLQDHLRRLRRRFPFERMGPWLNVVGVNDPVTASRGINRAFPEVLDHFVDTGAGRAAHRAVAYLDQDVVAQAIAWVFDEDARRRAPGTAVVADPPPIVRQTLAEAQYAWRVERVLDQGDVRDRFAGARAMVLEDRRRELEAHAETGGYLALLGRDNAHLLRGQLDPPEATQLLLWLCMGNPIAPYVVGFDDDREKEALSCMAQDLGFPRSRAGRVLEAEEQARNCHNGRRSQQRLALMAVGAALLVAAPYAVLAAAPAGLAGGAGIVAGLAALGPGGMVGGLGVVGAVGGAGGAAVLSALTLGSAEQVEQQVIYMQALVIAGRSLGEPHHRARVWPVLTAMETRLTTERARLGRFSDEKASILRELDRKIATVRRAIDWLSRNGLGPAELAAG